MKKTIKLRDMTFEQFGNYAQRQCGQHCQNCPLNFVCNAYHSWTEHKKSFTNEFLDQTVEIEVPDLLTEEEKALLKQLIKSSAFEVKAIEFVISSDFVCVEFINNRGSEQNDCFHFQKSLFKGIEQTKQYTFEDLGLEDK